jgi:hypothetical protein
LDFGKAMQHWILETDRCPHCGKVTYESREDAEYAAQQVAGKQTPYECLYGNGWHLTTGRKRGQQTAGS